MGKTQISKKKELKVQIWYDMDMIYIEWTKESLVATLWKLTGINTLEKKILTLST